LEQKQYQLTPVTESQELMRLSKHAGWCTKRQKHADDYLLTGNCYFLQRGRRPSYLIWSGLNGRWEFKGKANKFINAKEFCEEHPYLEDELQRLIPKSFTEPQETAAHMQMNEDGTMTLTLPCGASTIIPPPQTLRG